MKFIYISIGRYAYESSQNLGVFLDAESADKYNMEHPSTGVCYDYYSVEEWDLENNTVTTMHARC